MQADRRSSQSQQATVQSDSGTGRVNPALCSNIWREAAVINRTDLVCVSSIYK